MALNSLVYTTASHATFHLKEKEKKKPIFLNVFKK